VAEFLSSYPNQILNLLWDEGMGIRGLEAKADPSMIPAAILQAVPDGFKDGSQVSGFGIGGGTGIGKTQAVASLLKVALGRYAERVIVPSIEGQWDSRKRFPSVCWSSWPDEVHWLRTHAIAGAEDRVERLATAQLLVLDDLGRERIKGDYSQDWGASQLDYIVNARYRAELPTIWTTNVRQADLVRLYGAAMVRRLIEPNPLVWVEGLKPFNLPGRSA
jgi:DNA replication protein DnaC